MSETDTSSEKLGEADIRRVMELLPHRYPMLMIDGIKEMRGTESAIGIKNVTFNEPHFQGHFPQTPIMPGVTIVEAMAQTSAVMVSMSLDLVDKEPLVYFMGIDKVKFRRKVVPGDVLKMHITTLRGGSKIWKFDGKAMVDGELACSAEFSAMIDLSQSPSA